MRLTKTTLALIALVGILILSAGLPGSVASRAPVQETSCMNFGDCDLITCNPNGSTTFTFAVTNLSNFAASSVHFNSVTPSGVTISPNPYTLTPLLPPHATRQITVTIGAGLPNGTTVCFTLDLIGKKDSSHCSSIKKCITLGACGPVQPLCASGACCGGAPHITTDPTFTPFVSKRLAVTTSAATIPTNTGVAAWNQNVPYTAIQSEAVVRITDITETSNFVPNNVNLAPPIVPTYYGPPGHQWTHSNLGTVFGITLDRSGNIFVLATSAYNGDYYPAPGTYPSGTIWRIDGTTGIPSVYAQLPNFSDPTLVGLFPNNLNETYPALGDIAYDCRFDQFFVTNLEDGKIYRMKSGNTSTNLTGSVASTFDPFQPDNSFSHGFAPLGERLVAVKVHNNRVYYSRWVEDCGNVGGATNPNEIWSVGLNTTTGDFVPSTNHLELQLPPLDPTLLSSQRFSNPVFDISFSRAGNMLLPERTMHCDPDQHNNPRTPANAKCYGGTVPAYAAATLSAAHAARVLEYLCNGNTGGWTLSSPYIFMPGNITLPYRFNIGNLVNDPPQCPLAMAFRPANAAGGVDYDYSIGPKYTVATTGDALLPYTGFIPYGLQLFPPTGGGMYMLNGQAHDAVAIDLNGIMGVTDPADKSQIGDVEIVCPPSGIEKPR